MRASRALFLAGIIAVAGCDLAEEPFRPQVVVEAMLYANESFPQIFLGRTFPIAEPVGPDRGGVSGATIQIDLLSPDGQPEQSVVYEPVADVPGLYAPLAPPGRLVIPLRRYRLTVRVPDELGLVPAGAAVRGETLVPDTFRVVQAPPDTVRYAPLQPSPGLTVTRSFYPGRQAVYLFSILAMEPENYPLTPTFRDFAGDGDPLRFAQRTSPILNEASYESNPDGTISLRIPWLAIAYYGPHQFIAQALDDAVYDFLRSRDAQFGSATLSPGEIPEVLTNLENAAGVFGSASRQAIELFVLQ